MDSSSQFDAAVGQNLARLRQEADMSQSDVAEAMTARGLPWHQQTVLKTEKGQRPLRLNEALTLSDVLNVPEYWLWDAKLDFETLSVLRPALERLDAADESIRAAVSEFERARHHLRTVAAPDLDRVPKEFADEVRQRLEVDTSLIAQDAARRASVAIEAESAIDGELLHQLLPHAKRSQE